MNKPYVRKIDQIGEFTVWEVDGHYIRDHLNREFTNFGQHYRFPFIPKYEFWLDHESSPGETEYFIEHLQAEWHCMDKGDDFDAAIDKADRKEQKARNKSALMKNLKEQSDRHKGEVPKAVYREKLLEVPGNISVWVVSGEAVRDKYFIDFTEGGHYFVYDFVPLLEVWLDDDLTEKERPFVLLHELHERNLMETGMSYVRAHASSSAIEYVCRRDPKKLEEYMEREISILAERIKKPVEA
jgi:hypothetical protein